MNPLERFAQEYLTAAEAARVAGCSESWINKELQTGRLRSSQQDQRGHALIRKADLTEWIEERAARGGRVVSRVTREQLQRMRELRQQGLSNIAIAEELGLHPCTISKYLAAQGKRR